MSHYVTGDQLIRYVVSKTTIESRYDYYVNAICSAILLRNLRHIEICENISDIHTYIIGHYNPSVRIIDLVSHTTYVVCVNCKKYVAGPTV